MLLKINVDDVIKETSVALPELFGGLKLLSSQCQDATF